MCICITDFHLHLLKSMNKSLIWYPTNNKNRPSVGTLGEHWSNSATCGYTLGRFLVIVGLIFLFDIKDFSALLNYISYA